MLIGEIRPTTLAGVKSLAAQLRKEQGIKYSEALDLAAQAANCTNFRNAIKILPTTGSRTRNAYVLLTVYWMDKDRGYLCGRETLRIDLSKPILEICGKQALKSVRGFGGLRMVAADHFVADLVVDRQDQAQTMLCSAQRSLRFMEATGLRPARNYREAHPRLLVEDRLPHQDHATRPTKERSLLRTPPQTPKAAFSF